MKSTMNSSWKCMSQSMGLDFPEEILLVVEVYEDLASLYSQIRHNNRIIWTSIGLGFTLLYGMLFGIVWRASKTMKEQTASLIHSNEQLIQADKMVSLGTLSAGIAHEINNPNQNILSNTKLIEKFCNSVKPILDTYNKENGDFSVNGVPYSEVRGKMPEIISAIQKGSHRISRIVEELSDFSRRKPAQLVSGIDLNAVVKSAESLTANMLKNSTRFFSMNLEENLPTINGNFQALEQVVINLLINACQALQDKSKRIEVSTTYDATNAQIVLKVKDEGEGIQEEDIRHIFDPFFTTRRDRGGTGLGLSISRTIIDRHDGSFDFVSKAGKGSTVTVRLPVETRSTNIKKS